MLCSWDRYLRSDLIGGHGPWTTGALGCSRRRSRHRCDAAGSSASADGMHTAGDHPAGDPTTCTAGALAVVHGVGSGMSGNTLATHRSAVVADSSHHHRAPGKTMHHRAVTTDMMGRHRIATGHRQQPRNERAPHLANRRTAQGCRTAVLASIVHRRITDKPRLRTLEMQVTKRLASLARASKIIDWFVRAICRWSTCRVSDRRAVLRRACQVSVLDWLGHWPVTTRVRSSGWVDA